MNHLHETPFILAGCRRSGTTLLTLLLTSHPKIFLAGEMHFVFDYFNAEDNYPDTDEYRKIVCNDRRFLLWDVEFKNLKFTDLVNDFILQKRKKDLSDKPLFGVCAHENFAGVHKLWPEAKFIHLVKDPRDVANSYVSAGWAGNVWYGVDPWIETERQWDIVKKNIPEDRYIEIQFEELIQNPRAELTRICEFLGVAYTDEMFKYSGETSYETIDPSKVFRWKSKSSLRDIALVETKVGELLEKHGYNLSEEKTPVIHSHNLIFLSWIAIDHAVRYLLKKSSIYGWNLTLQHIISRRLPFEKWRIAVQKQIDKITNENLQ